VQGFFDHVDHPWLVDRLRVRSDDRAFLQRIQHWLQAGGWEPDGPGIHPETGTPHGGTVSPVLATASLHDAVDLWCTKVVRAHGRGDALVCRFADDWVCACRSQDDAERCSRVLPKRLETCNLQGAPEKTRLLRFSRLHPSMKRRCTLLGFACAWRADRHGVPRVKRRTARQKLQAACRRMTAWITQHRHLPGRECLRRLHRRVQGHDNYDGVRGNFHSLHRCFRWAIQRA
jgi:RNA-directed DNA polymerase